MINTPDQPPSIENPRAHMALEQKALLWVLFFLICFGLGHAPLNRYDPGKLTGTSDVADYEDIVVGRQYQPVPGAMGLYARINEAQNLNRVLVPYVAKPFYWLGRGHLGSWDPALFGLLVANAIFHGNHRLFVGGHRLSFDAQFSDGLAGRNPLPVEFLRHELQSGRDG